MSGAHAMPSSGTSAFARTSPCASSRGTTSHRSSGDDCAERQLVDRRERCANFGDIAARSDRSPLHAKSARVSNAVPSPSFAATSRDATRHEAKPLRFVVTGAATSARIVCDHAGLNVRTAIGDALRSRVRAMLLDFSRATLGRGPVDRNDEGAITPAFDRENFLLAATTSMGGIKHGTVRTHSIPRGRAGSTFLSRARQAVRHRREPDPDGASFSTAPSRPGFPREGSLSSEELGSVDQGGPKWRRP
jgi:hypothetical protein